MNSWCLGLICAFRLRHKRKWPIWRQQQRLWRKGWWENIILNFIYPAFLPCPALKESPSHSSNTLSKHSFCSLDGQSKRTVRGLRRPKSAARSLLRISKSPVPAAVSSTASAASDAVTPPVVAELPEVDVKQQVGGSTLLCMITEWSVSGFFAMFAYLMVCMDYENNWDKQMMACKQLLGVLMQVFEHNQHIFCHSLIIIIKYVVCYRLWKVWVLVTDWLTGLETSCGRLRCSWAWKRLLKKFG